MTLMLSGLAAAIFIGPVAVHRLLFRFRVKDEVVDITNFLALVGMAVLSMAMVGAILLVSDWVAGATGATVCTTMAAVIFATGWFLFPMWLRRRAEAGAEPAGTGPASPVIVEVAAHILLCRPEVGRGPGPGV